MRESADASNLNSLMLYMADNRMMTKTKTDKTGNFTILEKYRPEIRFFIAFFSVRF